MRKTNIFTMLDFDSISAIGCPISYFAVLSTIAVPLTSSWQDLATAEYLTVD